jgi:hypothetical protein
MGADGITLGADSAQTLFRLAWSPGGLLLVNLVMKLDIASNRVFGDPGIGRQDFQNFSPTIFLRIGTVNHRICVGDNLDRVCVRDLSFWKSKAYESIQCGQLKSATEIIMEHLLDELAGKNGEARL